MSRGKLFAILVIASLKQVVVCTDGDLKLNTDNAFILPGAGFSNYIKHTDDITLTDCRLTYPSDDANHTLAISMRDEQDFSDVPIFGKRLSNLERNLCGITVSDSREGDPAKMTLLAGYTRKGETGKHSFNATFMVSHYLKANFKDTVRIVELGQEISLTCGFKSMQRSCALFDPRGKVVTFGEKLCDHRIDYLTMEHIGKWSCVPTLTLSMKPQRETVELRLADTRFDVWYKEEDGFGKIGCRYFYESEHSEPLIADHCTFVNPRNRTYIIDMSSALGRYTSVGTYLDDLICQIEFPLPLLEEEIGTWKVVLNKHGLPIGGYVGVHAANSRALRRHPRRIEQQVSMGLLFNVACAVPYAVKNCYIVSPSGEFYYGGGLEYFAMGECVSAPIKAEKAVLGIWSCHFSGYDVNDDDVIHVQVVEEYHLVTESSEVAAEAGGSVTLMCQVSTPINACQFVAPDDSTYSLSPAKSSTGNIRYAGRGLEYGACGLQIKAVRDEHAGVWLCIVNNMGNVTNTLNDTIRVKLDANYVVMTHNASAIGVPIGIMLIAVLLLVVGVARKFTKRTPASSSRTSEGSNTDIPIFDIHAISGYESTSN